MSTNNKIIEIEICVDCLFAIANGEYPEDPETAELVSAGLTAWRAQGYSVELGSDEEGSFSWSACDCCRSHLGGDRETAYAVPIR